MWWIPSRAPRWCDVHHEPDAERHRAGHGDLLGADERDVDRSRSCRAAVAGKAELRSWVAVNRMEMTCSWPSQLRSMISVEQLGWCVRSMSAGRVRLDRRGPRMAQHRLVSHDRSMLLLTAGRGAALRARAGPAATAVMSSSTSAKVSSRDGPGLRVASPTPPIRVRTRRSTGWPTASHIRRTWRLRPSWMVMRSRPSLTRRHLGGSGHAVLELDALAQRGGSPPGRGRPRPWPGTPSRRPWRGGSDHGPGRRRWSGSSSPSVIRSRRPTGKTRGLGEGRGRGPSCGPRDPRPWSPRRRAC